MPKFTVKVFFYWSTIEFLKSLSLRMIATSFSAKKNRLNDKGFIEQHSTLEMLLSKHHVNKGHTVG